MGEMTVAYLEWNEAVGGQNSDLDPATVRAMLGVDMAVAKGNKNGLGRAMGLVDAITPDVPVPGTGGMITSRQVISIKESASSSKAIRLARGNTGETTPVWAFAQMVESRSRPLWVVVLSRRKGDGALMMRRFDAVQAWIELEGVIVAKGQAAGEPVCEFKRERQSYTPESGPRKGVTKYYDYTSAYFRSGHIPDHLWIDAAPVPADPLAPYPY